jgi:hypothetical protein
MRRTPGENANRDSEVDRDVSRRGCDTNEPRNGAAAQPNHRPALFVPHYVKRAEGDRATGCGKIRVHAGVDGAQTRIECRAAVETCDTTG